MGIKGVLYENNGGRKWKKRTKEKLTTVVTMRILIKPTTNINQRYNLALKKAIFSVF